MLFFICGEAERKGWLREDFKGESNSTAYQVHVLHLLLGVGVIHEHGQDEQQQQRQGHHQHHWAEQEVGDLQLIQFN